MYILDSHTFDSTETLQGKYAHDTLRKSKITWILAKKIHEGFELITPSGRERYKAMNYELKSFYLLGFELNDAFLHFDQIHLHVFIPVSWNDKIIKYTTLDYQSNYSYYISFT